MYGKVFESIYDGTLHGHWQAIVTMQQLIVLATEDGVVDMTPKAIADRTTIPLRIIEAGLEHLAKPDQFTRTPGEDGRRIVPLDDHRPWGWRLVNYAKYRGLRNMEQKKQADRERLAEKRNKNRNVAIPSQSVANVAHADAEAEAVKDIVGLSPDGARRWRKLALEVLIHLNEKTKRDFQPVDANTSLIVARLKEGASVEECKAVIETKCEDWMENEKMQQYLRPATLFNATKFAQYRGEIRRSRGVKVDM